MHPPLTLALTSPLRFPHTARRWRSKAPTVNSHPGSQRSCQSSKCVRGLSGRHYTHHFRPSISSVLNPKPRLLFFPQSSCDVNELRVAKI